MSLRPAISAPLPWLTALAGRFLSRPAKTGKRRSFLRLPRILEFTREGKWFTAGLFVIGIAAVNTGNNLLYLVLAMLLSLIIISGIMSETTLRHLRVERSLPATVFRGVPVTVRLTVVNGKRRLSSYSFTVKEEELDGLETEGLYLLELGGSEKVVRTSRYTFGRRGEHRLRGFYVETRFPFGLFKKGKEEVCEETVLVYPNVKASTEPLRAAGINAGELETNRKGTGIQLYGLRDYTLGDDSRYIHWKSTARAARTIAKEFEQENDRTAVVEFENLCNEGEEKEFEERVDEAASILWRLMELNYRVGLKTLSDTIAPAAGRDHLYRMLHRLALIEPAGGGRPVVRVREP